MLEALGFRFMDDAGSPLTNCCGGKLERISSIDGADVNPELLTAEFHVACDVDAYFTGSNGATCIFGPQKGADTDMLEILEKGKN